MKKLIYENDIPNKEEAVLYEIFGSYRGPLNTDHRFKPGGITDNRDEWKRKLNGLKKCRCGGIPRIKEDISTIGHGHNLKYWWIECECSIRTTGFDTYYDSDEEAIKKAVNVWNNDK